MDFSGCRQTFVGIRDRAMLLMSSTFAFRGDSARNIQWSDLFSTNVPMDDISLGAQVVVSPFPLTTRQAADLVLQALAVLSDNAKHNQSGRIDESGAFRHRLVELCPVGALAMLFFGYFHILDVPVPDFRPDFDDAEAGEYGHRDWYGLYLFSGRAMTTAMSYDSKSFSTCL
jgi:Centromere DNA-binding protein complex CBF3 subunit, domain 2